jgi:hypothetical protein
MIAFCEMSLRNSANSAGMVLFASIAERLCPAGILVSSDLAGDIITLGGFDSPVLFFQARMIHAWYAKRSSSQADTDGAGNPAMPSA